MLKKRQQCVSPEALRQMWPLIRFTADQREELDELFEALCAEIGDKIVDGEHSSAHLYVVLQGKFRVSFKSARAGHLVHEVCSFRHQAVIPLNGYSPSALMAV